mmetsp:Transcript_65760/g.157146  ORF Transcript_65760/g.157146 Transcript_65760/m.157146 type:complete len:820 (+) Transcript_65760:96-2555(+)|eukprot:CAMPEP_0178402150 /NCGR_PEP_ID=MMETSP0689_2-20121128/16686_1 /TAXON_ID=160604 /ORGANISM="Amphidinium massartii, Strain CS-259" /LENGTH=819 /DNA_ID=CAMNT_0020023027 /DNA_START=92 /DNA_END=2551 /DNA_ORIENTATION=-
MAGEYSRVPQEADTKSPLMGSEQKKAADMIVLLPWGEATKDLKVDRDDVEDFVMDMEAVKKPGSIATLTKLRQIIDNKSKPKVPMQEVQEAFLYDLGEWMPKVGVLVEPFVSQDEDEVMVRLTLNNFDEDGEGKEEIEKYYAEKFGTRVQLDEVVRGFKGPTPGWPFGVQQEWKSPTEAPYITYTKSVERELLEDAKMDQFNPKQGIFRKYFLRSKEGATFRGVDRIRLLRKVFGRIISLGKMQQQGVILAYYPVHYKHVLDDFTVSGGWASMRSILDCSEQPLDRIRNYFGEGTAFFCAWIGFTIRNMLPVAFLGLILKVAEFVVPHHSDKYALEIDAISALILIMWGAVYMVRWKRREHYLRVLWDTEGSQKIAALRADFKGTAEPDPHNLLNTRLMAPRWKGLLARAFSIVVTSIFLILTLSTTLFIFKQRDHVSTYVLNWTGSEEFADLADKKAGTITNLMISIEIAVFNLIWGMVVPGLLWLENHRTNFSYVNSSAWLNFSFQAFNSYHSFLIIAGAKYTPRGCVPTIPKEDQTGQDCVDALQLSLFTTFGSLGVLSIVSALLPRLQMAYNVYQETKALKLKGGTVKPVSFMERQAKMFDYPTQAQITDMLDLVIALGYVFMFGAISPAVTFIALVVFLVRLRCHTWKLCNVLRRPFPDAADGLGAWNEIIESLCFFGLFTSVAIPLLNYDWVDDHIPGTPEEKNERKLIVFFILEHSVIMLRGMISLAMDKDSADAKSLEGKRDYMTEKLIAAEGEASSGKAPPKVTATWTGGSQWQKLDDGSSDWPKVEKADEETDVSVLKQRASMSRDDVV